MMYQVFDYMERHPPRMVNLLLKAYLLLALVPHICISQANSAHLDKYVSREISNNEKPGFISIDCGIKIGYLHEETGIWYDSDKGFVDTGENHETSSSLNLNYPSFGKPLMTLRCFPEGDRNCYTLKPKQGKNKNYLLRAFFSYGNYDGNNQTQSFDLYLGLDLWRPINISPLDPYKYTEIIHTPSTDTIQVCLIKTGPTIPCIASLELRLLNNSTYQTHQITSTDVPRPRLKLQARPDVGSLSCLKLMTTRYGDDVYDRIWYCDPDLLHPYNDWYPLNLDESINMELETNNNAYKLPDEVLRSAVQPGNVSHTLGFTYADLGPRSPLIDRNSEYYVYFHFTEIVKLSDGKKRKINITLNSQSVLSEPLVLDYLKPITLNFKTKGDVWFNISATSDSDAPPILNAFEIHKLITPVVSPTDDRDVGTIMDIKSSYQINKLSWQGDPCLPKIFTWEGLVCKGDTIPRITSLNLSSSKLAGEINISFSYLTELESLDLSHNELEGHLPEFLAHLPKLKVLNLTGNRLSGPIPKDLKRMAHTTLQLSVDDNPDLCIKGSCKNKNIVVPIIGSLSGLVVILLISLAFWRFRRQKVGHSNSKKRGSLESTHEAFSYTEILNITNNFKTTIGEGGFGKVYLGILQNKTQVAVKMLSPSSMQGYKEFQSEAQLLAIVHHRNLVSLIGYCDEGEIKALIYEYMANGNLQQHLFVENSNILNWNERLNIAVDAAQGLDYMHNGCKPPILHRDLKPSNILLDDNMHAKISDFGLSRAFGNDVDSHISTGPAGTLGYADPEYQRTGNTNKKNDIYSFGIILFELITGQKALTKASGENLHILEWVIPIVEGGDIQNVVDSRLQGEFSINSAWKVVEIAMSCTSPDVVERPDMSEILVELKECLSLDMVQRNCGGTRAMDELVSVATISESTISAR
ncbi:probable LRR receptor-like serine/threonine-protein kinase At1g05700 [Medicago truncatula]|uniref:probable LRR receptor-like serine/threonine-protein kinase At1g05700 n=1 Tax=Medicago truncatula TaxID=3880 RepID=UPI000D2F3760|nr:probable LRR receptor-like serine/threonine-protein kinase At1g05700 [Medicago truncatula]